MKFPTIFLTHDVSDVTGMVIKDGAPERDCFTLTVPPEQLLGGCCFGPFLMKSERTSGTLPVLFSCSISILIPIHAAARNIVM